MVGIPPWRRAGAVSLPLSRPRLTSEDASITLLDMKKLLPRHEAIIDFMVANPHLPVKRVAEHFGMTPQALYLITNSELFRRELAKRRQDHLLPASRIQDRMNALAEQALDKLLDNLTHINDPDLLLKIVEKTSSRSIPSRDTPSHQTNIQLNLISPSTLESARSRIREILSSTPSDDGDGGS